MTPFFIPISKSEKNKAALAEGMVMRKPIHWPHPSFFPTGSVAEAPPHTLWDSASKEEDDFKKMT